MGTDLESGSDQSPKGRVSVFVVLIAMTLAAIALLFFTSLTYFKSQDREAAQTQLSLYQRSLNENFDRHQHLPFILAQDAVVSDALITSNTTLLNQRLAAVSQAAKLEAIYLMDTKGHVVASSNYDKAHSFVGQNYGFRPYFQEALSGSRGNYFGVGATTGRPGYFVSEPVKNAQGDALGIIAIKLDVSELQQTWEEAEADVLATNPDGIVVLASKRSWLYRTTKPLTEGKRKEIAQSKQFASLKISSLPWMPDGDASIQVDDSSYIYAASAAEYLGWTVHFLLKDGRAQERALLTTVVFGSVISFLVGIAAYLRSIRIQSALRSSQSDRELLWRTNRKLESAHAELAQTSKLAALGQLSASVVHELGQPISAFRNYLAAEEIGAAGKNQTILNKLNGVVDRMENITKQLRFFTKPGDQNIEPIQLKDVLTGSWELMQHDIELADVSVKFDMEERPVIVLGNRLRLEQVLVNLIKNSLFALQEASTNQLFISSKLTNGMAVVTVSDNGTGIGDRSLDQLQEPFHTTRASGDGMGLGLSISSAIVKEHNGRLTAHNIEGGGACFQIHLPVIDQPDGTIK